MPEINPEIAKLVADQDIKGLRKLLLNHKTEPSLKADIKQALTGMDTPAAKEALADDLIAQIKAVAKQKMEDRQKEIDRKKLAQELVQLGTKKGTEFLIKIGLRAMFFSETAFQHLDEEAKVVAAEGMMKEFKAKKPYTPPALFSYCKNPEFKQRGQVLTFLFDQFLVQKKIQPTESEIRFVFEFKDTEGGKYKPEIIKAINRWKDFEIRHFDIAAVLPSISPEETELVEALRKAYQRTDFEDDAMEQGWVAFYLKFGLHDEKNPVTKYGTPEQQAAYNR